MEERRDEAPLDDEIVQAEAGGEEETKPAVPVGEPEPEEKDPPMIGTVGWVAVATVVGLFLFPAACPLRATSGASRSARIVWEERQAEVAQVVAQAEDAHGPAQGR